MMLLSQLIQEVIGGTLRRNTFTPCELQLLLDLQACRIRKSTKPDVLRRYLKAAQQHSAVGGPAPLRFSEFFATEQLRVAAQTAERAEKAFGAACPG